MSEPRMNADKSYLDRLSERIIGCALTISNGPGAGFLEKANENALAHELRKAGLKAAQQHGTRVWWDGIAVGEYAADILVEDQIIVELKAVRVTDHVHAAQCLNYLKATNLKLCLLINFGNPRLEIKRFANNL